jgi:hypothetical protein
VTGVWLFSRIFHQKHTLALLAFPCSPRRMAKTYPSGGYKPVSQMLMAYVRPFLNPGMTDRVQGIWFVRLCR